MQIKLSIDNGAGFVDYQCAPISPTGLLLVPADVVPTVIGLDALPWTGVFDEATKSPATGIASAAGISSFPVAIGGRAARSFPSTYIANGGLRYHCPYANDTKAHNFVYAGDLWFDDLTPLGQMELDNNQVTVDGKTYIFGVQANNNSGSWDVTSTNQVTKACKWNPTAAKGCPNLWPAKQWLHFEIASHRDDAGNITYDAIHFNGTTMALGVTYAASLGLKWAIGVCLVNLQIDGALSSSGSILVYGSNFQMARW